MAPKSNGTDAEAADPIEAAAKRLEHALAMLESRVNALSGRADDTNGGLFDHDRSQLAAELDEARARQRDLKEAGAEASLSLGRAIESIRAALGETGRA